MFYSKYLMDIDLITLLNYLTVSMVYQGEGHWEKAAEFARKGVEMNPGFRWGYFWLAQFLARAKIAQNSLRLEIFCLQEIQKILLLNGLGFSGMFMKRTEKMRSRA